MGQNKKIKISGQDRLAFFPIKLPFCWKGVFFITFFPLMYFH